MLGLFFQSYVSFDELGNMGDGKGSVVDEDDDEDEDGLDDEGGTFRVKPMLVDLVGRDDNAHSDPLVHLDGVEQKPDDDDQMDGLFMSLLYSSHS